MSNIDILTTLESLLEERKSADPDISYVARLYKKGSDKIAQKVGEEAVETAMATAKGDDEELAKEAADLLFHLMVLLKSKDMNLEDVAKELARREGISGLTEKASRSE
ncbi:phosphoribosyl-ATP diphosphatase [Kordiimonas sp. SCSIO 12610]|uniref:phosphoribosyl-ATP diphosphatase n=1 Tax=Kordiimonas sp. SCSIO 12610 TaxID=2829597 RepID=UPI00210EF481|nr:phosphoribosyl-ATP diphosphatase [Kordiimonas sp. SCSIO 12610]UTW55434.1 phosphoribosyl-ATP diphosphatase [Kordiimonas sp. SCSIO 12610]